MNNRATKQWSKARIPYGYLREHILSKSKKSYYGLTCIDLLMVANFKGGSATIAEPSGYLKEKLQSYSKILSEIGDKFAEDKLGNLPDDSFCHLLQFASSFCELTKSSETKIDGFGPSFASALLNAYFPNLLPILDKRGLNGASIKGVETSNEGQVKSIESHYQDLIRYFRGRLQQDETISLEQIDENIFGMELDEKYLPLRRRE